MLMWSNRLLLHEVAVALRMRAAQADVLVEVERHDAREVEPLLAVHADQLGIHAQRRAAGGQPQHAGRPPPHQVAATNWAARRLTPSLSFSTITRIDRLSPLHKLVCRSTARQL